MKKKIQQYMAAGIFSFISLIAAGQDQPEKPSWVTDKGYWVVESNIHTPLQHSIRFYNNENVLIGRKELSGVKLDTRKRKVKLMLKEVLESSLLAWENSNPAARPALVITK
jgi:hypothetical protein